MTDGYVVNYGYSYGVVPATGRHWDDGVSWRSLLVSPPTEEPIDLDYFADKVLRVVNDQADDEAIREYLAAARECCESDTGRALMPQTWQLILDRFPSGAIELPRPPLLSVTSIAYVDADGAVQTLLDGSPATFQVLPSGQFTPARLVPLYGESWPSTRCQADAVTVTYVAGYATAFDVPRIFRAGIGLLAAELYKNRTLSMNGGLSPAVLNTSRFWKRVY